MAFFKGFDYVWPQSVKGLFHASQTVSGGGLGSSICSASSGVFYGGSYIYTEALMLMLLGPVCLVVLVTGLVTVHSLHGPLRRRIYICVVYIVFLFQPIVIKGIIQVMTCSVSEASMLYTTYGYRVWFLFPCELACGRAVRMLRVCCPAPRAQFFGSIPR